MPRRLGLGVALTNRPSRVVEWHRSMRGTLQIMPDRSRKRPRDPNQLGKLIVDTATGEAEEIPEDAGKDPAAVALGRRGGLKGGKARAESMTPEERSMAARRAAQKRWSK